eukprot:CAMPEP_0182454914 /NCGR_PEP_ID=MMETSP1319-20130603/1328_1 /TAXON_ID=172717 /ORGANISM="Bolidomonas pacifica, Strain RCC208" /LENGTH=183 /DNA_ID=CAMNT_0024652943 /DNA_START=230 /DNA_END=782 /DNA_ORIENTATION=-
MLSLFRRYESLFGDSSSSPPGGTAEALFHISGTPGLTSPEGADAPPGRRALLLGDSCPTCRNSMPLFSTERRLALRHSLGMEDVDEFCLSKDGFPTASSTSTSAPGGLMLARRHAEGISLPSADMAQQQVGNNDYSFELILRACAALVLDKITLPLREREKRKNFRPYQAEDQRHPLLAVLEM